MGDKCYIRTIWGEDNAAYADALASLQAGLQDKKVPEIYAKTSNPRHWLVYTQSNLLTVYTHFTDAAPTVLLELCKQDPDALQARLPGWLSAVVIDAYRRSVDEQVGALKQSLNLVDQHLALFTMLLNAKPSLELQLSTISNGESDRDARVLDLMRLFQLPEGVLCLGFYKLLKAVAPLPSQLSMQNALGIAGFDEVETPEADAVAQSDELPGLPRRLDGTTDWDAIERLATAGSVPAMRLLGMRAGAQGEAVVAERWLRQAAAGDDVYSALLLGGLLAERGRTEDAKVCWEAAAAAGDYDASIMLAMLGLQSAPPPLFRLLYKEDDGIYSARVECIQPLRPPSAPSWWSRLGTPEHLAKAIEWYEQRGYQIIDRRFRKEHLVVFKHPQFAFCEVAKRERSALGVFPDQATLKSRVLIKQEAREWMTRKITHRRMQKLGLAGATNVDYRFDLVSVFPSGVVEVIEGCY